MMFTPVLSKKMLNTCICMNSVTSVMARMSSESMARSTTTVPSAFANDTLSHLLSTPQRMNSPMRGTTRLTAYETKTECTAVAVRGRSPIGSSVCFQRHALNIWARMPKGNDSHIHVQSISRSIKPIMLLKSKSRYIQ